MGAESFMKNSEKGLIEVAPLAYMRGRTLDNAFIILDEAQNTTPAQMKMFLTRIGFGSKGRDHRRLFAEGSAGRHGIRAGCGSEGESKDLEDISICTLTNKDVVRHPLVQKIVKAYEDYEKKANACQRAKTQKGGNHEFIYRRRRQEITLPFDCRSRLQRLS